MDFFGLDLLVCMFLLILADYPMPHVVQHTVILTMADQWKVVYDLSNGAISNDLE